MQITETKFNTRGIESWKYWKDNDFIPLSIRKDPVNDYYELVERKTNNFGSYTVSTVAYFDEFEDVKQFIFQSYELDLNDCVSRVHKRLSEM